MIFSYEKKYYNDIKYLISKYIVKYYNNALEWFDSIEPHFLALSQRNAFLYIEDNKVVGLALVKEYNNKDEIKISTFIVDEDYRRRKVGTNLLTTIIDTYGMKDIKIYTKNDDLYKLFLVNFNFRINNIFDDDEMELLLEREDI